MSIDYKKILFKSYRPWLSKESKSVPTPTQKEIPQWYKDADRFAKNPFNGEYYKAPKEVCPFPKPGTTDDYGMIPTWKAIVDVDDNGRISRIRTYSGRYRDWETDRKSTRLNSSHRL